MRKTKQNSKTVQQQTEQNYKCFKCGEPIYFKKGFKTEDGKAQRFNVTNDKVHVCNESRSQEYKETAKRRAQKAYFARLRQTTEGYIPKQKGRETRQQRENREYNERVAAEQAQRREQEESERRAREQEESERRAKEFWNRFREQQKKEEQKYYFNGMTRGKAIAVLKLSDPFTKDDLERAKRAGWLKYHPDRNHGVGAKDLFEQVTTAYEYLIREVN